jgi:hypothetical protein
MPVSRYVLVFDAAGQTGCSGTPIVCQPMWRYETGATQTLTTAAFSGDGLFVIGVKSSNNLGTLYSFDASGVNGCSGTPKTCTPRWTASGGSSAAPPSVANHTVYVSNGALRAFDARGTTDCSGTPKVCTPLWTSSNRSSIFSATVANGLVYIADDIPNNSCGSEPCLCESETCFVASIVAFDANGAQSCTAGVCNPVWQHTNTFEDSTLLYLQPVVANGVVYVTLVNGSSAVSSNGNTEGWKVPQ